MKNLLIINILTLIVSSALAQDMAIDINEVKAIQLASGEVIHSETFNEIEDFPTDGKNLIVTKDSTIKKIQLKDGIILRPVSKDLLILEGGDMGGGR